jgi:hypothetical protein
MTQLDFQADTGGNQWLTNRCFAGEWPGKVRFATGRQAIVRRAWWTQFDRNTHGLKRLGLWGIATKQLEVFNVAEGIYSLTDPECHRSQHDEARREMEILQQAGAT